MAAIIQTVLTIIAFLMALTFHEFCHALAATLLGDPTAKRLGRLTLNPLAHIDPLGMLLLILVGFGWAKPVPFDARYFTHPRLYSILVACAGPLANFVLAFLCLVILNHLPAGMISNFLQISAWINVMLGVFNILPFPPLDGSHFISANLPSSLVEPYRRAEPFFLIALVLLLLVPAFNSALLNAIILTTAFLKTGASYF
jgi:Zn-dependent protease